MSTHATVPVLEFMTQVRCDVGDLVNLGAGPYGERRCVPLLGGSVSGPGLNGEILPGGADWQILRADGVLDIQAHYIVRTSDGALVEVDSRGLRHGPRAVMQRLAQGEAVAAEEYFFRTLMRFQTGHPAWQQLNTAMALARGARQARVVLLDVFRIG